MTIDIYANVSLLSTELFRKLVYRFIPWLSGREIEDTFLCKLS